MEWYEYEPSTINHQPSTINHQPSTINHQPSTINHISMEPTQELIDDIYRKRVLRARETPPEEKLLDGPRLFEMSCRIMADGIRHEFPDADEQQVQAILKERLALLRRLEATPFSTGLLP